MKHSDRRAAIVHILASQGRQTAEGLGRKLDASPRTIYRDIAKLRDEGVPIVGEAGHGLTLDVDRDFAAPACGIADLMALAEAARLGLARGMSSDPVVAARAIERIEQALPVGLRPGHW